MPLEFLRMCLTELLLYTGHTALFLVIPLIPTGGGLSEQNEEAASMKNFVLLL